MAAATASIAVLRIVNTKKLGDFNPSAVVNGSDPFGSDFAQLHGIATRIRVERSLIAFLSFCVWLRVFKYTRAVPVFGTIGRTMTRAFPAVRLQRVVHALVHAHICSLLVVSWCRAECYNAALRLRPQTAAYLPLSAAARLQTGRLIHCNVAGAVCAARSLAQLLISLFCMQIATYIAMSLVVFVGFAQSFFLGFYTSNEGFQSFQESLMSMVRAAVPPSAGVSMLALHLRTSLRRNGCVHFSACSRRGPSST